MKKLLTITLVLFALTMSKGIAMADEPIKSSSAMLVGKTITPIVLDYRVEILKDYLEAQDSPLAPSAQQFIESADKHNLDWKLLVSIAGLESSFGKHKPANSHNAWGWGYNGGTVKHFDTWEEAIEEISRGLRENYLKENEGSDPYIIGPTYAASPTWAVRVESFMNKIENHKIKNDKSTLSLAL